MPNVLWTRLKAVLFFPKNLYCRIRLRYRKWQLDKLCARKH